MLVNTNNSTNFGQIVVAPEVMMTVVREAALSVSKVASLTSPSTGIFRRGQGREGVTLQSSEGGLKIDVHVTLQENSNMVESAKAIQVAVIDAVDQIVGTAIETVDVHIENISFTNETA